MTEEQADIIKALEGIQKQNLEALKHLKDAYNQYIQTSKAVESILVEAVCIFSEEEIISSPANGNGTGNGASTDMDIDASIAEKDLN